MLVLELFFLHDSVSAGMLITRGEINNAAMSDSFVCLLLTKFLFELKETFFEVTVFFR